MTTNPVLSFAGTNFAKPGMLWVPKTTIILPAWARFFGGESSLLQASQSQDKTGAQGSAIGLPIISANYLTCTGANIAGIDTPFVPQAATALTAFVACQVPTYTAVSPNAGYAQLAGNKLLTSPANFDWYLGGTQYLNLNGVVTQNSYAGGNPTIPKLYAFVYRPGVNQQLYDITGGTSTITANTVALPTQGASLNVGSYGPGLSGFQQPNQVFHASFFPGDLTAYGTGGGTDFLNVVAQIRYILLNKNGVAV
jgi:hypothetical protein